MTETDYRIVILPNDKGSPAGKLADAELHFTTGVLAGLRLIGFAVWEKRHDGGVNVTFPARQYSVNGERRSFALLRPVGGFTEKQDLLVKLITAAWRDYSAAASLASDTCVGESMAYGDPFIGGRE